MFSLAIGESAPGSPAAPSVGGANARGNGTDRAGIVAMLSDADLNDLLFRAVLASDQMLIRAAVAEAVTRHAGIEPGRAVAGMYYLYRTLSRA